MASASPLVRSPSSMAGACCLALVLLIQVAADRPSNAERPTIEAMPKPYTERGPGSKTFGTQFIAPEIFENLDERFAKHTENDGRDALINLAKDLYTTAHGERTSLETAVDDVRGLNPLMRNADHDAEAAEKAADVLAKDGISAMHKASARNQASIDSAADILKQGHKSVYEGVTRHEGHLFAKQGYTSNVHGQDNVMPSGSSQDHVMPSGSSQVEEDAGARRHGGGRSLKQQQGTVLGDVRHTHTVQSHRKAEKEEPAGKSGADAHHGSASSAGPKV